MNHRNILSALPPVTKNLIIINLAIWLLMMLIPSLGEKLTHYCALHFWGASDFNPAQLLSYMFIHDVRSFAHILFNMFTLFMFGITLERVLGSQRYLFYYLSCGIGAALVQELVWQFTWVDILAGWINASYGTGIVEARDMIEEYASQGRDIPILNGLLTVGASGAIYGVLLAFGMIFPNRPLYLMFVPIPIKAKWMVIGYGALELLIGLSTANDGIAHFAHLGGMLFGFLMIWYWKKTGAVHGDFY
ncbi:MAG: rhomboid family intramembrane serine protease [Pseudoflavonifractor sp.]|nr:rhomboid family intramembrane serine protease [Alloprevotella sp.]MCM1116024.1 rhomboid family intramembrane serine protease [Pseudoflavonifractor sp.]